MDKKDAWPGVYAEWVSAQPMLNVVYAALHRGQSVTPPTSYIGLCYQAVGEFDSFCIGKIESNLPNGHLAMISSHQGGWTSPPRGPIGLWAVTLHIGEAPEFASLVHHPLFLKTHVKHPARLVECYENVIEQMHDDSPTRHLKIKAAVLGLVANCVDEFDDSGRSDMVPEAVENAERFMRRNHADCRLAVGDVAAAVHLSVRQLDRLFRQWHDISPMQMLRRIRVNQARMLLEATSMRISDVAREVGFEDALHFSRIFSQTVGASPMQYRKGLLTGTWQKSVHS